MNPYVRVKNGEIRKPVHPYIYNAWVSSLELPHYHYCPRCLDLPTAQHGTTPPGESLVSALNNVDLQYIIMIVHADKLPDEVKTVLDSSIQQATAFSVVVSLYIA